MNGSGFKNVNTLEAAVSEAVVRTLVLFVNHVIPHLVYSKSGRHFYGLLSLNNARMLLKHLQAQELDNFVFVFWIVISKLYQWSTQSHSHIL